jgi:hypothetical protein
MSKKAPAIHTASEAAGPHLLPGHFNTVAGIEPCLCSCQS